MGEEETIRMMRQIEAYIAGNLSENEIDQLWIEFLKAPEWYEIFEIELILRMMGREKIQSGRKRGSKQC